MWNIFNSLTILRNILKLYSCVKTGRWLQGCGLLDKAKIALAVRMILEAIGEDLTRPGLQGTPERVADAYEEIFANVGTDPGDELDVFFQTEHEEIVLLRDIPFFSVCEHHLLPFTGQAHVVYIPRNGRITGLSKLARLVEATARRPQLQERLTAQIADALMERLKPLGAMVVVEAEHLCMTMRGVRKPGAVTVTSAVRGVLATSEATRAEALSLINGNRH